jgi:ribosomal protein S17
MMKSVTVAVTRMFRHARLDKTVRETKQYMARRAPPLPLLHGALGVLRLLREP